MRGTYPIQQKMRPKRGTCRECPGNVPERNEEAGGE